MTILFKKQIQPYKDYDEINKCKIHSYLQLNTHNLVRGRNKTYSFTMILTITRIFSIWNLYQHNVPLQANTDNIGTQSSPYLNLTLK